ncbi:unnamed protein product [Toxocara canis]|nr:unnamed protein product [Toxocara canis]
MVDFTCHTCGMREKCFYGNVKVTGRSHTYRYKEEVYYLIDPFRNRAKVDERRVQNNNAKGGNVQRHEKNESNRVPNILDFFVIGALCAICGQSVCLDELCSVFYWKTFCSACVMRERARFPSEIVQQIEMARTMKQRRDAEREADVNAPLTDEDRHNS